MGKETKRQTVAPILLSIFLNFGQKTKLKRVRS